MFVTRLLNRLGLGVAIWAVFSACAPSSYVVKEPTPSGIKYEAVATGANAQLSIVDERRIEDRVFSSGVLPAQLMVGKEAIDAPQFLAKHLEAELASRGLSVGASAGDAGQPRIRLRTFRIQNHRVNAYTPFVTFTYLSADLETGAGTQRIGVYVKRGKVPVWSFAEVVEPTFNQPLSLAVKEFAGKVAVSLFSYRASDSTVSELAAKIANRTEETYLDVYALGFTNNPAAIDHVVKLLDDADEYVRLAAISSLGNLRAVSQMERLKAIYQSQAIWQDRAMAIKAIADLGTPEAKAFLDAELKNLSTRTDNDSVWTSQILALYL